MNTDTKNASFYVLFFVFLLCNKPLNSIAANDTISTGQTLGGTETITSKNGNFVMGFFRPGKSQWYYIGIWYNNDMVSVQTIVWVANRDKPLRNIVVSGLHLSENGDLVIYDYDPYEALIWSTNTSSIGSNTTEAVLGDDGNLVIRDKSNSSVVYWQSFDYPTDTWLPGGKMNVNKLLTSWRNQEDPASGIFKLEFRQPDYFKYHIVTFRSQHTENWDIGESFQQANSVHNFSYISNENGSYLTYNLNSSLMLSRFVLDVSGQIKQFILSDTTKSWNLFWSKPQQLCDVYGVCGPFGNCNQDTQKCDCWRGFSNKSPAEWNLGDSTGGCQRNTPLQCGSEDDFSPIPTSKLPDYSQSRQVNRTEDCKSACQSTCSCNAYAYGNTTGCQLWEEDMLNTMNKSDGKAGILYLRLAASEIRHGHPLQVSNPVRKRKRMIWKFMIPVIVSLVAIIIGVVVYMYPCKRHKANERGSLKELQGVLTDLLKNKAAYNETPNTNMVNDGETEGETHEIQIFDLVCLATATNNFCLKDKLGEGGFGPVYKGKLQNGKQIAVKRLSKSSRQGIEEFKNEVVLISKLQHRNLVKLLGCCIEAEENMLIYEYMSNNSLDSFLFDPRNKACLDWVKRFNIIGGIARGLLYLHRDSRLRVIHRDLKVSNILLDEEMIPKISDFGMARMFAGKQTSDTTSRVVGTMGYMSPEYMVEGTFSEKSDVFSFGVLVLEVVSGKRNNSFHNPEQPLNLLLHAWRLWNEGKWSEIVDEDLGDKYSPSEVLKCIHIGLLCSQNSTVDRPTMAEVDLMLGSETDRPSPKEPPHTFPASAEKPDIPLIHCSNNDVTLSTVGGR